MYLTKHGIIYDQQTIIDFIFQALLDAGWTVFDNISSTDKVFTTTGESVKNIPLYVRISTPNINYISTEQYPSWDATTHTGTHLLKLHYALQRSFGSYAPTENTASIFAVMSKDYIFISIAGYVNGVVTWSTSLGFGYIPEILCSMRYMTVAPIVSGTNVSIQLDDIEHVQLGVKYQIIDKTGKTGCETVRVNNLDDGTSTVIVDSVTGNYPDGIYFGYNIYPVFYCSGGSLNSIVPLKKSGTPVSESLLQFNDFLWGANVVASGILSTMFTNPAYLLNRCTVKEQNEIIPIGHFGENLRSCRGNVYRVLNKSMIIFNTDNTTSPKSYPTAVAADFTSITDSRYNWAVNGLVGKYIVILSGYGAGQSRKITANTNTTVTVENPFLDTINRTSQYTIVDNVFRCLLTYVGEEFANFYARDVY